MRQKQVIKSVLIGIALVAAACASNLRVRTDYDQSANFKKYRTFSIREGNSSGSSWAKNPRALAGRLRRAQTFLRTFGIEITFSREGRTGSRMIRVSTRTEDCVSSVSLIRAARGNGSRGDQSGTE